MPITLFQKKVLTLLAQHRSPDSHVAGGLALNAFFADGRLSRDADIFHDTEKRLDQSAEQDTRLLVQHGYLVEWLMQKEHLKRAKITLGIEDMTIDWAFDSAFRYFPAEKDETLGWRLHLADLATNKALALTGRSKTRDLFDMVLLDKKYLRLEAIIWAACGKDEGFNPQMMLEFMNRNARVSAAALETLRAPVTPVELKKMWIKASDRAQSEIEKHRLENYGFLLLDQAGRPRWHGEAPDLKPHYGTVGGAVPSIADELPLPTAIPEYRADLSPDREPER